MAIKGLKPYPITKFTGKDTTTDLSAQALGTLTAAQNCLVLADQNVRRAPGYTQLFTNGQLPDGDSATITTEFDFQRTVDGAQYILVQRGKNIYASKVVNGVPGSPALIDAISTNDPLSYVPSSFICYMSNGVDSRRFVDIKGLLNSFNWGIKAPTKSPTSSFGTSITSDTYTYAWDFGDTGTSALQNPTHTYAAIGVYRVTLTVTNSFGGNVTVFRSVIVSDTAGDTLPLAEINGPYSGNSNSPITFSASGSKAHTFGGSAATTITDYAWDFGDGSTGSGDTVQHQYDISGNYIVTLVVTNSDGDSRTVETSAIFRLAPLVHTSQAVAQSSGVIGSPFPYIDGPYFGRVSRPVSMSALGSSDPNFLVLTYDWDFGDGNTGTGQSVTHTYAVTGIYTVTLNISNTDGLMSSLQVTASIYGLMPNVYQLTFPTVAIAGASTAFDGTSVDAFLGLYLDYGRSYVYSKVSKYIDGLGIQRVHVSAPSPISPQTYTGPDKGRVVSLTIPADTDMDSQVNYYWVFATADAPQDTNATYFFAFEVPYSSSAVTVEDAYADSELNQTILAPFDNFPPPAAPILARFQSRIFALKKSLMQFSGGPDITVGIPDEAFPADNFFTVPVGSQTPNAIIVPNEGNSLAVSIGSRLIRYTGYDASSFTQSDAIITPGQAGRWAGAQTPYGWAMLSPTKRLWLWDGSDNAPTELSSDVSNKLMGTFGMDDLDPAYLPFANVLWYSFGVRHFITIIARTTTLQTAVAPYSPEKDWMSLWSVPLEGINGPNAVFQTDKFPSDLISCAASVFLNNTNQIIMGTKENGVMLFPEGFTDDGNPYASAFSHAWVSPIDGRTRYCFLDLIVDCSDNDAAEALGGPSQFMRLSARVMEAPEDSARGLAATVLSLKPIPVPTSEQGSNFAMRASLQIPETSFGRYIRVNVTLAQGDIEFDVAVQKIVLFASPIFSGVA